MSSPDRRAAGGTAADVVAVIDGQRKITYAELNERANQLAHYLRRKGVGLEVRVGVLLERSLEFDVALLAILKAGGTYVPLDAAYPRQRLQFMLEDAGVNLLLTDEDHAAAATDAAEIVYLDDAATFAGQSRENPENISKADDLAYVMYTSGSTGQPKGVAVTHRAINGWCETRTTSNSRALTAWAKARTCRLTQRRSRSGARCYTAGL
jgi:non-ribosomal peptide synthetase component F